MPPTDRFAPIPPGEILRTEFLEPMDLSVPRLAAALALPEEQLAQLLAGHRSIDAESALRLGHFFGNSARFWLNLQVRYDLEVANDTLGPRLAQEVQTLADLA